MVNIENKLAYLVSLPICEFSQFGAILIAECWAMTGGVMANAYKLPEGRKRLIDEIYDIKTRDTRIAA